MTQWFTLTNGDTITSHSIGRVRHKKNDKGIWQCHIYANDGEHLGITSEDVDFTEKFYLPAQKGQHAVVFYLYENGDIDSLRYDVIAWRIYDEWALPIFVEDIGAANALLTVIGQEDGSYISAADQHFPNLDAAKKTAREHADKERQKQAT